MTSPQTSPQATADLTAAAELLADADDVTLLGHVNPDADALGSALALGLALREGGADVRVSFAAPDAVPETLASLDVGGLFVPSKELPPSERLLVAVDTPSTARLGWLAPRVAATVAAGGAVLVVDHHASNDFYGTHHVVDTSAEASAVLALRLLDELGAPLTEPIARCLYAGLVTDTSSFRRATAETHRMAARLVEAGVDPDALGRQLLDDHPFAWLPMLSEVLAGARLEPDAVRGLGLVHAVVTREAASQVRGEEVESVVDVLRSTSEAEVALVLKETEPHGSTRRWTVSMRAKSRVDLATVARSLGGGGHRLAAGCTLEGEPRACLDALRAALAQAPLLR